MGKNVPVSCADVDLMEKIFEKDVATLKGKTIRPHPPVVKWDDAIDLPSELKVKGLEIELAINVVYINDQSFLHSIDQTIKLRGLSTLGTRKGDENYIKDMLYSGINNILCHYNKMEIYVTTIHADNDFRPLFTNLEDKWDIKINFSLPGEHVLDIERANRTLQERYRVELYRLPYRVIPQVMIRRLVLRIT